MEEMEMLEKKTKKLNVFKRLHASKKKQLLFFCISMTLIVSLYLPTLNSIKAKREVEHINIQGIAKDFSVLSSIEMLEKSKKLVSLSGWVLRLNCENKAIQVICSAVDNSDIKIFSTEMKERRDVNEYFSSENDFGKTGFVAQIEEKRLDKDTCYEIAFSLDYENSGSDFEQENKLVSSGKYYFNGEIYAYDPSKYYIPEFDDVHLNEVLKNGKNMYFDIEIGCWMYLYDNKIYFIANEKFGLPNDRTKRMKFHTHTAQNELLTEIRQQYGYDSRDFYFDEKEYLLSEESEYRVAIIDIPDSYEVSWVELGMYKVGESMIHDMAFLLSDWNEIQ